LLILAPAVCASLRTLAHPCSPLRPQSAHPCAPLRTRAHPCARSLRTRAHPCAPLLTLAHPCSPLRTRAPPCSPLRTLAHPCSNSLRILAKFVAFFVDSQSTVREGYGQNLPKQFEGATCKILVKRYPEHLFGGLCMHTCPSLTLNPPPLTPSTSLAGGVCAMAVEGATAGHGCALVCCPICPGRSGCPGCARTSS
jgi:hypothetical protein